MKLQCFLVSTFYISVLSRNLADGRVLASSPIRPRCCHTETVFYLHSASTGQHQSGEATKCNIAAGGKPHLWGHKETDEMDVILVPVERITSDCRGSVMCNYMKINLSPKRCVILPAHMQIPNYSDPPKPQGIKNHGQECP